MIVIGGYHHDHQAELLLHGKWRISIRGKGSSAMMVRVEAE